ncbi:MAG TPA: preprotein translocase subunit YajC [Dissulfurispiraceae bacterium]|nr:preprotein translocase subunit YajC [Dissulfurispiraceae bacterium]
MQTIWSFVTEAHAMAPAPQGGGQSGGLEAMLTSFAPLVIIFAIFYFLLIRPQKKKAQDFKKMLDAMKAGDKVVTAGGIYGVIERVRESTVDVKIAPNTTVELSKNSVSHIRTDSEKSAEKDK